MHHQLHDDWALEAADWGALQPAVHRSGGATYLLPQPVRSQCVLDIGSGGPVGTPLSGSGTKPAGVNVVVKGEILLPSAAAEPHAESLLDALTTLRDALDVENATTFDYYLHHDATNALYRRLHACTALQFDWELVGPDVVEYAFALHTTNRTIDDTAPV